MSVWLHHELMPCVYPTVIPSVLPLRLQLVLDEPVLEIAPEAVVFVMMTIKMGTWICLGAPHPIDTKQAAGL